MNHNKYELLLASVIAARATSFIFNKMLLAGMGSFTLLAIRFLIAFALLMVIFHSKMRGTDRRTVLSGIVVGAMYFVVMSLELTALKSTASSTVSMIQNCSIIFVPLFESVIARKLPEKMTVASALLAMSGVVCLTFQVGSFTVGMIVSLIGAMVYACAIMTTARVSRKCSNPFAIGVIQLGSIGVLALTASAMFDVYPEVITAKQWAMMMMLVIVCSGFGFTLQPVAQSRVSAERAGLFCAIGPAVATVLGAVVLHEEIGAASIAGLALILTSIMLPYIKIKGVAAAR